MPSHEIARLRIAQSPEGRRIFPRMTVLENLQMGATVADPAHFDDDLKRVCALFPLLDRSASTSAAARCPAASSRCWRSRRALMSRPRLLLLDEPSLGLAPMLAQQIFRAIRELNQRDRLTVFLVEQNAFHALKLAHRGYVIVNGEITLSGSGRELLERPEVRAAYLEGGRREAAGA